MSGVKHTPVMPYTPGHLYFDDPTWDQKIALRGRKTVYGQPYVVAHVNRPGSARADDDKRYARLFCAAPDLLAALERSAEGWANALELKLIPPQHRDTATILRDEARAAIARARGEQDGGGE
ncbi:hypothetical protein [Brevundimonas diminuta]|uniref:hypothetical protein n=1 Tax=Brevundimonas diminuta TaxID=293 RepID=UPI0025A66C42|nr:hypothetical protein [Brevundimonas diminuta]MDM8352856.1 hypothetical protein [Brevundimonas diminuta]